MNTLNPEFKKQLTSSVDRAYKFGEWVLLDPEIVRSLLNYTDQLEQVSQYADSVCSMLTEGGWPGKREALESRIAAAIKAAQGINSLYEEPTSE